MVETVEHKIVSVPALDSRGIAFLFDLYVDGKWIGSARTIEHCAQRLTNVCGVEVAPVLPNNPW